MPIKVKTRPKLKPNQTYHKYQHSLHLKKGMLLDPKDETFVPIQMYSWDVVNRCLDKECPAHKFCEEDRPIVPYDPDDDKTPVHRCAIQRNYMQSVTSSLVFYNKKAIDQSMIFRMATELMPLYSMLFGFLIMQIGIEDTNERTWKVNGKPYIHPVYKEIRETSKLIGMTRRAIGVPSDVRLPDKTRDLFPLHGNVGKLQEMRSIRKKRKSA